jgi:hypothetical protein
MDGTQFDRLARTVAAASSRRTALRGLVAGFLGLAGLKAAGDADARRRCGEQYAGCNNDNDCCSGLICRTLTNPSAESEFRGTCAYKRGCGKRNDFCKKNRDCCRQFRCRGRRCKRR